VTRSAKIVLVQKTIVFLASQVWFYKVISVWTPVILVITKIMWEEMCAINVNFSIKKYYKNSNK
jgi:hypothetical protein